MSEKQLLVEELHAPARRNFLRRHVIVRGYDDLWQADVVEMRPYTRFNRGYHYILTVIDVLSKHAWAVPLKAKSGSEVAIAIAKIIRKDERCPKNLLLDLLPRLVSDYNVRKHRTIGMRPIDVTPAIAKKLLTTVYSHIKIAAPARFKVGDSVRVSKFKSVFEKGYTPNWTTEIFKIIKVQSVPILRHMYWKIPVENLSLEDSTNMSCSVLKGDEVYVKWLGFDGAHNSWIHKSNVI
ncbi:uncharacterized protein LOC118647764 [Monomorium pharaonis]|uniref:uncharacterized protein LOC118647764 n=1 Tax=Monomorium pharaonis TaxID=307658 RepID=UPI0017476935|nr:uncharacterized protein LOC118647764 [Monomorium pharaonis]